MQWSSKLGAREFTTVDYTASISIHFGVLSLKDDLLSPVLSGAGGHLFCYSVGLPRLGKIGCKLGTIVQDRLFSKFLVLGGSHHKLDPAWIGTVAFSNHPFSRESSGTGFRELQCLDSAFITITLIPKIVKLKGSVGGDGSIDCIANIRWTANFRVTNKFVGNIGDSILRFCIV